MKEKRPACAHMGERGVVNSKVFALLRKAHRAKGGEGGLGEGGNALCACLMNAPLSAHKSFISYLWNPLFIWESTQHRIFLSAALAAG